MRHRITTYFPILLLLILTAAPAVSVAEVINIDNQQLNTLLEQGAVLVDVRRKDEWVATGVVEGSHKITFFDESGAYDARKWLNQLNQMNDSNKPLVLICQTGVRSKVIANWLSNGVGTDKVYNVTDGISRWIALGQPVSKD